MNKQIAKIGPKTYTVEQATAALWSKVDKNPTCWLWTGAKDRYGYGLMTWRGKVRLVHRVVWELGFGEIGHGFSIMHTCDQPGCVNPNHMKLGTHQQNMLDCAAKRRTTLGERNSHAKLTEEQVIAIKKEYRLINPRRSNAKELAKKYGVNHGTIVNVVVGRSWKHLGAQP